MSRVLTSLHIDFPRSLPEISRLLPTISFSQLQQILLKSNRLKHDKLPKSSNQQSPSSTKQLTNSITIDSARQSSSTEAKRTVVPDSSQMHFSENKQPVSGNMVHSSEESVQPCSVTPPADKSHIQPTTLAAPVTDSVISKFNTAASGIARQIADCMPSIEISTSTKTKMPTHAQQKQESHEVDSKQKTESDEVKKEASSAEKPVTVRRQLVARGSIDRQTRGLVLCLRDARTSTSQLVRLEELCQHITQYPDCTGIAVKV